MTHDQSRTDAARAGLRTVPRRADGHRALPPAALAPAGMEEPA